jgi:hypothetical protein
MARRPAKFRYMSEKMIAEWIRKDQLEQKERAFYAGSGFLIKRFEHNNKTKTVMVYLEKDKESAIWN